MKIGIIAGMWRTVPPSGYGGIERAVFNLANELSRLGEEVVLFAPKGSKANAKLVEISDTIFSNSPGGLKAHLKSWLSILKSEKCDIYTNHGRLGNIALVVNILGRSCVHNFQCPIKRGSIRILQGLYASNRLQFAAISGSQIKPLQGCLRPEYWNVVYNGVDFQQIPFYPACLQPPYLAFVGRICPEKGPDLAIEIARQCAIPLIIAGPVQPHYLQYFKQKVEPKIDGKMIKYIGEIDELRQYALFGKALATLFPITWEEPFGIAPVYSLALGTPVIAFEKGAVREIIKEGLSGFIVNSVEQAAGKVKQAAKINRRLCRQTVAEQFTSEIMAEGYRNIFLKLERGAKKSL